MQRRDKGPQGKQISELEQRTGEVPVAVVDEADIYLPAIRQPATKARMEDLLKRARSAGVGLFLATQSPGDFDYKCKENVRTWLIGRVKEPRAIEKLKLMLASKPRRRRKNRRPIHRRLLPRPRCQRVGGKVGRVVDADGANCGGSDRDLGIRI